MANLFPRLNEISRPEKERKITLHSPLPPNSKERSTYVLGTDHIKTENWKKCEDGRRREGTIIFLLLFLPLFAFSLPAHNAINRFSLSLSRHLSPPPFPIMRLRTTPLALLLLLSVFLFSFSAIFFSLLPRHRVLQQRLACIACSGKGFTNFPQVTTLTISLAVGITVANGAPKKVMMQGNRLLIRARKQRRRRPPQRGRRRRRQ